jgi:hypothetical protein
LEEEAANGRDNCAGRFIHNEPVWGTVFRWKHTTTAPDRDQSLS